MQLLLNCHTIFRKVSSISEAECDPRTLIVLLLLFRQKLNNYEKCCPRIVCHVFLVSRFPV